MKLSEKNISLKSRKVRKSDAREMRNDRNEANFKLIIFNVGHFFPSPTEKGL